MADFSQLKAAVANAIKTNGNEEITGAILQDVLLTIINSIAGGYMFGGVAQHSGNVGNPDYNVFYLAGSGSYTGYGDAITIEDGCYGVFRYNGSWTQEVVDIGVRLSGSVTAGETRGCTGDTINSALQQLFDNITTILDTMAFTYNTPSAQQATKAMLDVEVTVGGNAHVLGTLTLVAATALQAGLMSAEDKQKVDAFLTNLRSLAFADTTSQDNEGTQIAETMSATIGGDVETIATFTLLAATASKAGLMSAADKTYLDSLPAALVSIVNTASDNLAKVLAMIGYYVCDTAAGTAAKTVSASGYVLTNGGCIRIKMTNANTADNVTLNINSTGAKALYYDGAQASSSNSWEAGEVLEVYYDGTQYQCASGGGGKFATGEEVKDISITNNISENGESLPTDGAVYNAIQPINDSVVNIISELGTTTQLTSSDFVQGTLDPSTGRESSRSDRIRTGFIEVENGYNISYQLNSQNILFYYYDSNKTYISCTSWISISGNTEITQNGYIKILVKIADGTTITPSQLAAVITIQNTNSLRGAITKNTEDIAVLSAETDDIRQDLSDVTQLTSSDFVQGSRGSHDGNVLTSTTRLMTRNLDLFKKDDTITIKCNGQKYCIYYFTTSGTYISMVGWLSADATYTIENDCRICFLVAKTDDSTIVPADLTMQILHGTAKLDKIDKAISLLQAETSATSSVITDIAYTKMFIGSLVQGGASVTGISNVTNRVSSVSFTVVPATGAKVKCILPSNYKVEFCWGADANRVTTWDYWYNNGDIYTFPSNANYFRLCFANSTNTTITAEEIQELIDSGDIQLLLQHEDDVVACNHSIERTVKASMRPFYSSGNTKSLHTKPVFIHTSDLHGDAKRCERFMDYADYLGVDAAFISGDMVAYSRDSSKVYVDDIVKEHKTMTLQCLGNHECQSNASLSVQADMLADCIESVDGVVDPNATYPTYYYKDFADKNIRVIVLNIYEGGSRTDGVNWEFPQQQCEWFIATLKSTPANYGVIVMMHALETIPPIDQTYGSFRQPTVIYTTTGSFGSKPFAHIIDAFIGKTSTSISYTSNNVSITVQADFTTVNSGVEFIAYVNGHMHADLVGFIPDTTYRQLDLNIVCGSTILSGSLSDLPRDGVSVIQDSFNVYVIDRDAGTVRITKVGSNITGDFTERKWLVIPYKD